MNSMDDITDKHEALCRARFQMSGHGGFVLDEARCEVAIWNNTARRLEQCAHKRGYGHADLYCRFHAQEME